MACNNEKSCANPCDNVCQEHCHGKNSNGFLIVLVLYILLAILLGSCILY